jgi:hypothetical protein
MHPDAAALPPNHIRGGYDFVEDYGDADGSKKSRSLRGVVSGPMICLITARRTLLSPAVMSAAAVMTSLISIQFVDSILVTVASVMTMGIALLLLLQQRKLRRMGNLRKVHNDLRRKANFFHQENQRLHRTQQRLDESVAELHYVPQELHKLAKNRNVDRLTEIVQENKQLQEQIRKKIQQRVMQQLLGVVVKADRDQDFALGPKEIDVLIMRMGAINGIEFNEQRFREMLKDDPSIHSIFKMLRFMQERDDEYQYGKSNAVFVIKPSQANEKDMSDLDDSQPAGAQACF